MLIISWEHHLAAAELVGLESSKPAEPDRLGGREVKSQLRWQGDTWGDTSWADVIFWMLQAGSFGCQDENPAPCKAFGAQCTPSSRSTVFSFCWSLTILQGTFFVSERRLPTYNQNCDIHIIYPSITSSNECVFAQLSRVSSRANCSFIKLLLNWPRTFHVLSNLQHISASVLELTGLKPEWN